MISREGLTTVHPVKHQEGAGVGVLAIEVAEEQKKPKTQAIISTYLASAIKLTLESSRLLLPKLAEFKKQASSPTRTLENHGSLVS